MSTGQRDILTSCARSALDVLNEIIQIEVNEDLLTEHANTLYNFKSKLIGDALFFDQDMLDDYISNSEESVEEDVNLINLATFAFNFYIGTEYQTCANAFFTHIVPFETYTDAEIDLYFGLKLALFRQKTFEQPENACRKFIAEVFPSNPEYLYLNSKASAHHDEIINRQQEVVDMLNSKDDYTLANDSFIDVEEIDENINAYVKYRRTKFMDDNKNQAEEDEILPDHDDSEESVPLPAPSISRHDLDATESEEDDDYSLPDAIFHDAVPIDLSSDDEDPTPSEPAIKIESTTPPRKGKKVSLMSPQEGAHVLTAEEASLDSDDDNLGPLEPSITINSMEEEVDQLMNDSSDENYEPNVAEGDVDSVDDNDVEGDNEFVDANDNMDGTEFVDATPDFENEGTDNDAPAEIPQEEPSDVTPQKRRRLNKPPATKPEASRRETTTTREEASPSQDSSRYTPQPQEPTASMDKRTYITESGMKRKVPKVRRIAEPWTEEEVTVLERILAKEGDGRSWAMIANVGFNNRRTGTQIKDKAENEVIRRSRENVPLGGFFYAKSKKTERMLSES